VLDQLHPQLGRLVHDLKLQLVVAREVVRRLLQGQQLLGADVQLVISERHRGVATTGWVGLTSNGPARTERHSSTPRVEARGSRNTGSPAARGLSM
jgi:hypothetical protein